MEPNGAKLQFPPVTRHKGYELWTAGFQRKSRRKRVPTLVCAPTLRLPKGDGRRELGQRTSGQGASGVLSAGYGEGLLRAPQGHTRSLGPCRAGSVCCSHCREACRKLKGQRCLGSQGRQLAAKSGWVCLGRGPPEQQRTGVGASLMFSLSLHQLPSADEPAVVPEFLGTGERVRWAR